MRAIDVLTADQDEPARDAARGIDDGLGVALSHGAHVDDGVRRHVADGLVRVRQALAVAMNVTDAGREIGLGLATMKDRYVMCELIEPAHDGRADEARPSNNKYPHNYRQATTIRNR